VRHRPSNTPSITLFAAFRLVENVMDPIARTSLMMQVLMSGISTSVGSNRHAQSGL
jgi:hypothetical protein